MKLNSRISIGLLAASAVSTIFAAGMAYADGSIAIVTQNGGSNSALVQQSVGEDHRAYLVQQQDGNQATITQRSNTQNQYFNPNGNKVGTSADPATQNGNGNTLTVYQDFVGNSGNEAGTGGLGIDQKGNANTATITQNSSRNIVRELQQDNQSGAGNEIVVNQGDAGNLSNYAYNRINSAIQINTTGVKNTAEVTQSGGSMNKIGLLSQSGGGNEADVTQTGTRNVVQTASQNGTGNRLTIVLSGNRNGSTLDNALNDQQAGAFPQWSLAAEFAAANGVQVSSVLQTGSGHVVSYVVDGNLNQFGIRQTGNGSDFNGITTGSENQLVVRQAGNSVADVFVTGDRNVIVMNQGSSGAQLSATIDLYGNGNNAQSLGGFTAGGPARTAAYSFMRPGLIQQFSPGSTITLNVGSLSADADNNRFSLYQAGGFNNTINGEIHGSSNQAAVVQDGSTNVASFSQIGGSNNLGIRQ